jgi:hypothetical protein
MKRLLTISTFCILLSALADGPPLPPGAESQKVTKETKAGTSLSSFASVTIPSAGLFTVRVVPYTPQISRLEFYCRTNSPLRWSLESSTDLVNWREVESYRGTNEWRYTVPILRDNAKLVTTQLVRPGERAAFYRIKPL